MLVEVSEKQGEKNPLTMCDDTCLQSQYSGSQARVHSKTLPQTNKNLHHPCLYLLFTSRMQERNKSQPFF
jgi:hypothetical protein